MEGAKPRVTVRNWRGERRRVGKGRGRIDNNTVIRRDGYEDVLGHDRA